MQLALIQTFSQEQIDQFYRADLNDQFWAINKLPEDVLVENYKLVLLKTTCNCGALRNLQAFTAA
jgi:hypothetical protein